jgi:hypothetical protein
LPVACAMALVHIEHFFHNGWHAQHLRPHANQRGPCRSAPSSEPTWR